MTWHILDAGSIWIKEFSSALSSMVPTQAWCPDFRTAGYFEGWDRVERIEDPALDIIRFPLQRGYAKFPMAQLFPFENAVIKRLRRRSPAAESCTLVCTTPFYAPVAERWPGRVVYYLTDWTKKYAGMNEKQVLSLDTRMCAVAAAVCPNSSRIATYLCEEAQCDPRKITIIPQATRENNVLERPLTAPAAAPADLADLPRPIVGVVGNLAGNMDWSLVADAVKKTKDVSWAFVGPTDMKIAESAQEKTRRDLMAQGGRIRFVGPKKYGELSSYARAFDVALMPYRKKEPTFSGSATRFYEHLAACRPILSSRGFHELLSKEPLLALVDDGDEIASAIERLRRTSFYDGIEESRWRASQAGTWSVRARDLLAAALQSERMKVA